MEPILSTPKSKRHVATLGFSSDLQKIPLAVYLHVNDFTSFQRQVLPIFLNADHTIEDVSRAIATISSHINGLTQAGWKPTKVEGDAVNQPDHYKRFPIEPTFYNQENGLDWLRGNANKYICRYPYKNGIEDLRKGMRCLVMYMQYLQGENGWSK